MTSYLVQGSENNAVCPMPPSEVAFLGESNDTGSLIYYANYTF